MRMEELVTVEDVFNFVCDAVSICVEGQGAQRAEGLDAGKLTFIPGEERVDVVFRVGSAGHEISGRLEAIPGDDGDASTVVEFPADREMVPLGVVVVVDLKIIPD